MLGCILKFRILLIIRNIILFIIYSSFLYWPEKIAESLTDKIEDLLHTSYNIYGPIQKCYAFWNSFLNDTFGFTCSFHIVDT
jgi:hypothetical protein